MKKEKMSTYTIFMSEAIKSLCAAPPSRARVQGAGFLEVFCSLRKHEMMRRQEAVWRQFHENLHCAATQNSAAATL